MKLRGHHTGGVLMVLGAVALAVGWAGPANADPPGNNGTIKVDGAEFDSHPDNEPHVGCSFQVDFYGYEANIPVSMTFEVQPPTGDAVVYTQIATLDGDDAAGGGSEAGLDGEFTIDLTNALANYEPQPNQGYHVKLTITADDGNQHGAQVKHKVYWVTGCGGSTTTTTEATTSTSATTTSATTTSATTTSATSTSSATTTSATTSSATSTSGATSTSSATTTSATTSSATTTSAARAAPGTEATETTEGAEVLGVDVLPRTGFSATLLVVGTTLMVLGLALEVVAQITKRRGTVGS